MSVICCDARGLSGRGATRKPLCPWGEQERRGLPGEGNLAQPPTKWLDGFPSPCTAFRVYTSRLFIEEEACRSSTTSLPRRLRRRAGCSSRKGAPFHSPVEPKLS